MVYGYARCSTSDKQDISRQRNDLIAKGISKKNIYWEYESGSKTDRIELCKLLEVINEGDCIVATEISRITRSTKQLIEIIDLAETRKLKLIFGEFVVDCSKGELDAMTKGMLNMMGVFAELERDMIRQRIKSGVANAKAKAEAEGREYRPSARTTINDIPKKFLKNYRKYLNKTINKTELAKISELSRPTINKYIKIIKETEIDI